MDIQKTAKRDATKIRDISELAKQFIIELNGDQSQFEVEEVVHKEGKWFVTLSYYRKISDPNELQRTLGLLGQRAYKRVTIDWSKQQVLGMSDWAPERFEVA